MDGSDLREPLRLCEPLLWLDLIYMRPTVRLNSKLFSESKLHKIEPLESCPEAIHSLY